MSLDSYKEKFTRLVVATSQGHRSPHKPCMLLAVLDLAAAGGLTENRIEFAPALLERYATYFNAVKSGNDRLNPWLPYYHLRGNLRGGEQSFWRHIPRPGREGILGSMTDATSARQIIDNIDYATLDDELYQLALDPIANAVLARTLAMYWFDRQLPELQTLIERATEISKYEKSIRTATSFASTSPVPEYVRNPAFRRVVIQLYDYRCAATGLRFILPTGEAMVEAAHIHPFSVAGDDDPRNGIALTPNMHWAMDRNLIAPGPDLKWHVSSLVDDRLPDNQVLTMLEGKPLIIQVPSAMPKREALEWRMNQLR